MHLPAAGGHAGEDPEATSAMIAKEQHKLEVLKRRQEREIQQVNMSHVAAARLARHHVCSIHKHGSTYMVQVATCPGLKVVA